MKKIEVLALIGLAAFFADASLAFAQKKADYSRMNRQQLTSLKENLEHEVNQMTEYLQRLQGEMAPVVNGKVDKKADRERTRKIKVGTQQLKKMQSELTTVRGSLIH